jgi:F420 biosynthesis protein FbiB-like protein
MASAWRADLEADRQPPQVIKRSLARSRRQLAEAPLLLLACLEQERARRWPDRRRRRAERDMYVQSLGAALQNLLLAAHARGLGGYLKGAPLFCQRAVGTALGLPSRWEPTFLVLLGHPAEGFRPPPRPAIRTRDFLLER